MKKEVNPIAIVAVVVALVAVLGYFGWKSLTPAQPSSGSYTPGVPPWMDKKASTDSSVHAPPGGTPQAGVPTH